MATEIHMPPHVEATVAAGARLTENRHGFTR